MMIKNIQELNKLHDYLKSKTLDDKLKYKEESQAYVAKSKRNKMLLEKIEETEETIQSVSGKKRKQDCNYLWSREHNHLLNAHNRRKLNKR